MRSAPVCALYRLVRGREHDALFAFLTRAVHLRCVVNRNHVLLWRLCYAPGGMVQNCTALVDAYCTAVALFQYVGFWGGLGHVGLLYYTQT